MDAATAGLIGALGGTALGGLLSWAQQSANRRHGEHHQFDIDRRQLYAQLFTVLTNFDSGDFDTIANAERDARRYLSEILIIGDRPVRTCPPLVRCV